MHVNGRNPGLNQGVVLGAAFCVWAPLAKAVYINGGFDGGNA